MGPIFSERVIAPPPAPVVVTAADALAVCLNETGKVDPATMADMLDRTEEEVIAELGDAIFRNPKSARGKPPTPISAAPSARRLAVAEASAFSRRGMRATSCSPGRPARRPETVQKKSPRGSALLGPGRSIAAFAEAVLGAATGVQHRVEVAAWSVDTWPFRGTAAGTDGVGHQPPQCRRVAGGRAERPHPADL